MMFHSRYYWRTVRYKLSLSVGKLNIMQWVKKSFLPRRIHQCLCIMVGTGWNKNFCIKAQSTFPGFQRKAWNDLLNVVLYWCISVIGIWCAILIVTYILLNMLGIQWKDHTLFQNDSKRKTDYSIRSSNTSECYRLPLSLEFKLAGAVSITFDY